MSNLTKAVSRIRDRVTQGFPEGVDAQSAQDLKILFNRIEELERALSPFARLGSINSYGKDVIECYHRDCVKALEAYRQDTSPDVTPTNQIFYPA